MCPLVLRVLVERLPGECISGSLMVSGTVNKKNPVSLECWWLRLEGAGFKSPHGYIASWRPVWTV